MLLENSYERGNKDEPRRHPYGNVRHDPRGKYYNFRSNPELIPDVLEDFKDWDRYEAIQYFFDLVLWINGLHSQFESTDSAFSGVRDNCIGGFLEARKCCYGRLVIVFRNLKLNCAKKCVDWLNFTLAKILRDDKAGKKLEWAGSRLNFLEIEIANMGGIEHGIGDSLLIEFSAWGNNEDETMDNLLSLFKVVGKSLRKLSAKTRQRSVRLEKDFHAQYGWH